MLPSIKSQKIGAHLSVAGGLHNAFDEAVRVKAACLAIFVKNQRQWKAPPQTDEHVRLFTHAAARTGIGPTIAHASYLLNLASPEPRSRKQSITALIDELTRCEALGLPGIVLHPGAHMGEGIDAGIARIAHSISLIHAATRGFRCKILLESTAGQGSTIGHEFSQLGRILSAVREQDRLGVCLDTCHLFAAGYDLRDREKYEATVAELDRHIGLDRVACIHVNDSKADLGSRLDRHEHIGHGRLGRRGFIYILNDPRLAHAPRIIETKKGLDPKGRDWDIVNIRRLRSYISKGSEPPERSRLAASPHPIAAQPHEITA